MRLWNTKFEKINIGMVITFITILALLMLKYFLASLIGVLIGIILFLFWCRYLFEELIISFLKDHGGTCEYTTLKEMYSNLGISAISRLEKKSIIKTEGNVITLLNKNCICAFDKFKRKL